MKNRDNENCLNQDTSDNKIISSTKVVTYLILTIVFITTSVLSLIFIYHLFSDKTSFLTLKIFPYSVFLKLTFLLIFYFLLDGLRLFYVLKTLGITIDFKYITKLAFINIFVSNITPFATGGGFAQVYFLNKKGVSLGDATAASTLRTVLSITFFYIVTPIILILDRKLVSIFPRDTAMFVIPVLIILYVTVAYGSYKIIYNTKVVKRIVYGFLYFLKTKGIISQSKVRKLRNSLFREIDSFTQSIKNFFKGSKKDIILSIVFTLLFLLSLFMFPVVLINGLNYNILPVTIILLQIVITFIMYFAPTPGATGIAEGGFTLIFSSFVRKGDIVSLTFAWRFFTIYIGMFIGMIIFYFEIIKNNIKEKRN